MLSSAREAGLETPDPDDFKVEIGRGVVAQWKGQEIVVGQVEFLRDKGIPISAETEATILSQTQQGRTAVLAACRT